MIISAAAVANDLLPLMPAGRLPDYDCFSCFFGLMSWLGLLRANAYSAMRARAFHDCDLPHGHR